MDKEKLQKMMKYASDNPNTEFAVELRNRFQQGKYDTILNSEGIKTKKPSLLKRIGSGLIKSEVEFGKSIAGAIETFTGFGGGNILETAQNKSWETTQQLLKAIKEKQGKGEDTTKLKKVLEATKSSFSNELLERQAGLSTRQVVGQAAGVGLDILGGGTIGTKAAGLVTKPTGLIKGALKGAGQGALIGGGFGAGQGAVRGLQEDKSGADLASETIAGGLIGGVAGGVLGGVTGGISGYLRGSKLRKQQLLDDLTNNPDTVAKYNIDDIGKITKDKNVTEVLKQGIPEKQVAVIKNTSPENIKKFRSMFNVAEKASKDAKIIERPTDIVGESIVNKTKHLLKELRKSGKEVERVVNNLKGQKVNPIEAVNSFVDDLSGMGVVFKNGKPVFNGSDIEGIIPAENLISKVVKRASEVSDNAIEIHRLKKFIDEQVTFGKLGEGLSGQTARILKGFRANLDSVLDKQFVAYNKANQSYSNAIQLFDKTKEILGRKFDVNTGSMRAGSVARRILGNSANRGDILEYIKALESFAKETGGDVSDDILAQTVFADILEDVFGTQATTGFTGSSQRALEQVGGVVQDIGQGQIITGLTRGAVRGVQALRGISDEAKIKALGKLIGLK